MRVINIDLPFGTSPVRRVLVRIHDEGGPDDGKVEVDVSSTSNGSWVPLSLVNGSFDYRTEITRAKPKGQERLL